jgi:hypothetical protein
MERELIRDLANELAGQIHALMQEGGVITQSIGEPLDQEDSILGRACAYLGKPIPTVPSWDEQLVEL